jgi:hypothetical protein
MLEKVIKGLDRRASAGYTDRDFPFPEGEGGLGL